MKTLEYAIIPVDIATHIAPNENPIIARVEILRSSLLAQKYIKNRPSQISSLAQCLYNFETLIACHDDGLHVKYVTSKAYKHTD